MDRGEPGPPRRRRGDHQRHAASSRATCRRSRSGCAGSCTPRSTSSSSPVDLHSGHVRRRRSTTRRTRWRAIIAALKGPDGRVRIPGFYDDVVALTDAEREAMAALPFDDEAYRAAIPVSGARRRGRAGRRSSARARGPRSTSTACGAASRARAPRRSSRRTPTRRSRRASWPTRTRRRCSRRCATTSPEIAPPGVTVGRPTSTAASPSPDAHRPPGHAGGGPRARGGLRAPRRSSSARAARSRSTAAFDHIAGPAGRAARASRSRRATRTRRTSGSSSTNFELGTRVIVRLWDELAALRRIARAGAPVPSAGPDGPGG